MNGDMQKREVVHTEYVIDVPETGLDAKGFTYWYGQVIRLMQEDGIDFTDDVFTVFLTENEIIFRMQPTVKS